MHYEINVSKHGSHFFATHERSIRDTTKLNEVYDGLAAQFPEDEGYHLSITFWHPVGLQLTIGQVREKGFNPLGL